MSQEIGQSMLKPELTKAQKSILLYLESVTVDYLGRAESRRMNDDDFKAINELLEMGLVESFERLPFKMIEKYRDMAARSTGLPTHFVILSDEGFNEAHFIRRERAIHGAQDMKKQLEGYQ